jgi:kinetochore protein Fta7
MPFPTTRGSTNTTDETFDFETTLNRISALQATLNMNMQSCKLLRDQVKRERRELKRDQAELAQLKEGLKSSEALRRQQEKSLHPIVAAWQDEQMDEDVEKMNQRAGIDGSRMGMGNIHGGTEIGASDGEVDEEMAPLLKQLRDHLGSMQNNTAGMMPVLEAMEGTKVALGRFVAGRVDGAAMVRRAYGIDGDGI